MHAASKMCTLDSFMWSLWRGKKEWCLLHDVSLNPSGLTFSSQSPPDLFVGHLCAIPWLHPWLGDAVFKWPKFIQREREREREGRREELGDCGDKVCLKIWWNAILLPGEINSEKDWFKKFQNIKGEINLGRKCCYTAAQDVNRNGNAVRGMVTKYGCKRGFAVRCLALHDPANELKLAAFI